MIFSREGWVSRSMGWRRSGVLALACAALLVGAGCSKSDKKATSQVAIKVNGQEVSEHQANLMIERHVQALPPEQMAVATRRVMEALVDRELAAQAARKDQLDQDPKVIQRMEAAKREVLAQAYLERLQERVAEPASDEIDRYHDEHPALFAQRRLYSLQETAVMVPPAAFEEFKAKVEATTSLDKMNDALRALSLKSSSRQVSLSAEDVPFVMLDQLAALKDGQSLVLPRDGGARVLTVLSTQSSPISRPTAQKLIAAYLIKERRQQAAQAAVKTLREQGQIEFQGRFAASTPATEAPPASAAQ